MSIERKIIELANTMDHTTKLVSELDTQLEPVSKQSNSPMADREVGTVSDASQYAARIESLTGQLLQINDHIGNIQHRLDIQEADEKTL